MGDQVGTLRIEYDDISMKTKLILTRFGGTSGTLLMNEQTCPNTSLGFTPYWDYKPTNAFHAGSPGGYTSEKVINWSTVIEIF